MEQPSALRGLFSFSNNMSRLFQLARRTFRQSPIQGELQKAVRQVAQSAAGATKRSIARDLAKYSIAPSVRASVVNAVQSLGLGNWMRRALKVLGGRPDDRVKSIVDAIGGVVKGKTKSRRELSRNLKDAIVGRDMKDATVPPTWLPTPSRGGAPAQSPAGSIPSMPPTHDPWSPPDVPVHVPPSSPPVLPPVPAGRVPPAIPPRPPIAPPAVPPSLPPPGDDGGGGDDGFPDEHGVRIFGRGAYSYDMDAMQQLFEREVLTPGSSNVYSFVFEHESRTRGILYVTFKAWHPGQGSQRPNAAGPTYAYYDVPVAKYQQFRRASASSAGSAVWDYLRTRGTKHGHQHPYRLVEGSMIPSGGIYVPRKATARGFRSRSLAMHGTGRRDFIRSSLPEQLDRGRPDRGTPDRGTPDRGN